MQHRRPKKCDLDLAAEATSSIEFQPLLGMSVCVSVFRRFQCQSLNSANRATGRYGYSRQTAAGKTLFTHDMDDVLWPRPDLP